MKPMKSMFRSTARDKGVPSLNMASMPDLIFTVLFFFMIVTHMRSDEVKVRLQVPQAKEVQGQWLHRATRGSQCPHQPDPPVDGSRECRAPYRQFPRRSQGPHAHHQSGEARPPALIRPPHQLLSHRAQGINCISPRYDNRRVDHPGYSPADALSARQDPHQNGCRVYHVHGHSPVYGRAQRRADIPWLRLSRCPRHRVSGPHHQCHGARPVLPQRALALRLALCPHHVCRHRPLRHLVLSLPLSERGLIVLLTMRRCFIRLRPYVRYNDLLRDNGSYPSGHSIRGWAMKSSWPTSLLPVPNMRNWQRGAQG